MEGVFDILIENLKDLLNTENASFLLSLEQRFTNKKFRKDILEKLKKAEKDRGKLFHLLEGIYMKVNEMNDHLLVAIKSESQKDLKDLNVQYASRILESSDTSKSHLTDTTHLSLKYSTREGLFLHDSAINISIPPEVDEFAQISMIKSKIGINRQLYFQLENRTTKQIEYFETGILDEMKYSKPMYIICRKKKAQLVIQVKLDGNILKTKSYSV